MQAAPTDSELHMYLGVALESSDWPGLAVRATCGQHALVIVYVAIVDYHHS